MNQGAMACMLKGGKLSPREMGFVVHAFGDSYAHIDPSTGVAYKPVLGHLWDGHTPDTIAADKEKYLDYADSLFRTFGGTNRNDIENFKEYIRNAQMTGGQVDIDVVRGYSAFGYTGDLRPEGVVGGRKIDFKNGGRPTIVSSDPENIRGPKVGFYRTEEFMVGGYDAQFGTAGPRYGHMDRFDAAALFEKMRSAVNQYKKSGCCQ